MREPTPAQTPATAEPRDDPPAQQDYDRVDDSGAASFPASDPPSWWSGPPT